MQHANLILSKQPINLIIELCAQLGVVYSNGCNLHTETTCPSFCFLLFSPTNSEYMFLMMEHLSVIDTYISGPSLFSWSIVTITFFFVASLYFLVTDGSNSYNIVILTITYVA